MDLCLYFPFIDLSLLYLYASIIAVKIKDIDCNKYQSGVEEYTKWLLPSTALNDPR